MDTMFDTLLQLPLFQGLAHEDFTNILGKVKLHFTKHKAGSVLATADDDCTQLIFILKGEVAMQTTERHGTYSLIEYLQAPALLEPQSMFGMHTRHASTYTVASDEVHAVSISKDFVLKELWQYDIFRLNFTNIISNRAQSLKARLWMPVPDDTEGRIVGFTSIRNDGYLHSMFIHKDHQGEGIATALLQRIEAYVTEHGIREITSEVSITARPFFERKGYKVIYEQKALCNRLYIKNYWMK